MVSKVLVGSWNLSPDPKDYGTEGQQTHNPCYGDKKSPVDREPLQTPPPGHDSSQCLAGKCLGQYVADVPGTC